MAVYDGFFDAVLDEETGKYDREYDAGDFTEYFGEIIGSGVCIHNNPDSFRVRIDGNNAVIAAGYLFIKGYWLKNDSDYSIALSGNGILAVIARLNMGKRMIELTIQPKAEAYQDLLVLAYVDMSTGTVEDTRYNTDVCGVIESAGGLSEKVEYAVSYIDNEIEGKLSELEQGITAQQTQLAGKISSAEQRLNVQSVQLDNKIKEVAAEAEKLAPPAIGSIKFSASQNIGAEWLKCDGSFVSEADYPELVAALGYLPVGAGNFTELFKGRVSHNISNGVIFDGIFWVYSLGAQKLYGVSLTDGTMKEIAVSPVFDLTNFDLIYLSIVEGENSANLYLSYHQRTSLATKLKNSPTIYVCNNFNVDLQSITMTEIPREYSINYADPDSTTVLTKDFGVPYVMEFESVPYVANGWSNYTPVRDRYNIIFGKIENGVLKDFSKNLQQLNKRWARYKYAYSKKNGGCVCQIIVSTETGATTPQLVLVAGETGTALGGYDLLDSPVLNGNKYDSIPILGRQYLVAYGVSSNDIYNVEDRNRFTIYYSSAFTQSDSDSTITRITWPTGATVFEDAAVYMPDCDMYAFFIGTGIVFVGDVKDEKQYRYYDTQELFGKIDYHGYAEYDEVNHRLYISGQTDKMQSVLWALDIPKNYNLLEGTYLPNMNLGGVPAYIKAKETEA